MNTFFDHEKLEVYQLAIRFVVLADHMLQDLPRGKAFLADQLQRACSSIALNIAEGAGEFSQNEKDRFYRIAKRSATECASILDIFDQLKNWCWKRTGLIECRYVYFNSEQLLVKSLETV